jgi:hypothetical protein
LKFDVYHSITPDFFALRNTDEFPHGYVKVASVECNTVDDAFRLTNNIDHDWWRNKEVTYYLNPKLRSTSVGDIVVKEGKAYLCSMIGWKEFKPVDHERHIAATREMYQKILPTIKGNCKDPAGLMPTAFVLGYNGNFDIVAMPFTSIKEKRMSWRALADICRNNRAGSVIIASEAWVAQLEGKDQEEINEVMNKGLEHYPGRKEVLLISLISHGFVEIHQFSITREGGETIVGEEDRSVRTMTQGMCDYFYQDPEKGGQH